MNVLVAAVMLAATLGDVQHGKRIYRDTCASCHRRSGFGTSEGSVAVPSVTGAALFRPRQLRRVDRFRTTYQHGPPRPWSSRARDPRLRPAYDAKSLATALRDGIDPAGRTLDPLMPRYRIGDQEVAQLAAYLAELGAAPPPGVDGDAIHFATVITPGVDPAKRNALLDVLTAYVAWKNAETRHSAARIGHSPWYRDEFAESWRAWKLDVWELRGPPETWRARLDEWYRKQPVFAVLSGLGAGSWAPVHAFCEQQEVPCLFPNTNLPVVSPPGAYALYFSQGLAIEAAALARHLESEKGRVVHVARDSAEGRALAADVLIPSNTLLTAAFWKRLVRETRPDVLVLWLDSEDAATLDRTALASVRRIVFSATLLDGAPPPFRDRVLLAWPFALPGREDPLLFRVRGWMRARRVALTHERLQLNAWFAMAVTDHALVHLVDHFSRDYLIENIEEETENSLSPGVFPSLSLGPGQRFASKGSYIVDGVLQPVSGWIVP